MADRGTWELVVTGWRHGRAWIRRLGFLLGAGAVVVASLQPHARLGYPRPVGSAVPGAVGRFGLGHRPAHRPLVAGEAHRQ